MSIYTCPFCVTPTVVGVPFGYSICGLEPYTRESFKEHLATCSQRPKIAPTGGTMDAYVKKEWHNSRDTYRAVVQEGCQYFTIGEGDKDHCDFLVKTFIVALEHHDTARDAAVAQSVERLPCKQDVGSSILSSGSKSCIHLLARMLMQLIHGHDLQGTPTNPSSLCSSAKEIFDLTKPQDTPSPFISKIISCDNPSLHNRWLCGCVKDIGTQHKTPRDNTNPCSGVSAGCKLTRLECDKLWQARKRQWEQEYREGGHRA
jgi:hypothetical protein